MTVKPIEPIVDTVQDRHAPDLSDATFAAIVAENSLDAIVVTDTAGRLQWANRAFRQMTGFTLDDVHGRKPGEFLQGPDTNQQTVRAISNALKQRHSIRTEILNYTKDREPYWIELNISPVFDNNGFHTHFMSIERDITKRKHAEEREEALRRSDERKHKERQLLSLMSEWLHASKSLDELLLVIKTSMETLFPNTSGQLFIYSNSRDVLENACDWPEASKTSYIERDDCWALRRGRAYALGSSAIEFKCNHVEDDKYASVCAPIVAHGDTIGLLHVRFSEDHLKLPLSESASILFADHRELALVCAEQISLSIANVKLRHQLLDQSVQDPLTKLWNRRWFLDVAYKELSLASESKQPLTLISIDVDHFKKFNDQFGHDAGDAVLRALGELMLETFTDTLSPCRLGGEEFMVLAPKTSETKALEIAEAFRKSVSKIELRHGGDMLPAITVSIGTAEFPHDGNDLTSLMKQADEALYAAKNAGRNRIVSARTRKAARLPNDKLALADHPLRKAI
ncbi:MAG: diguanylate cyclase [Pseudomonadota bacterium]